MTARDRTIRELREQSLALRRTILTAIHRAGSGHTGGSLSAVEVLATLYGAVLNVSPDRPARPDRDRVILSKGHAAPALYAVLAQRGFFPEEELATLRRFGSRLQGHPCMDRTPGVDLSTGSLGLGLSAGLGMALAAGLTGHAFRVYVLCGDGEMNEGQNWEALMAGAKFRPANLCLIVDRNHVQLDGPGDEIMPMGDLAGKIRAFGWNALECDGHDPAELLSAFDVARAHADGPTAIVARTVKGKGVSFMEGQAAWHGKPISDADFARAMAALEAVAP
jgi:transketolase